MHSNWKHSGTTRSILRRKQSKRADIALLDISGQGRTVSLESCRISQLSVGITGEDFKAEVLQKRQSNFITKLDAAAAVLIERLIKKKGKDEALLQVVSKRDDEKEVLRLVSSLLQRGATLSAKDSTGQTALHVAVRKQFKSVCRKLTEGDCLSYDRDNNGKMPYHLAIDHSNDYIAALLLNHMPNALVRDLYIASTAEDKAECNFMTPLQKNMPQTAIGVLDSMLDPVDDFGNMEVFFDLLESDEQGRSPLHPSFNTKSKTYLYHIAHLQPKEVAFHSVVRLLTRKKWKRYGRYWFLMKCMLFIATLFAITFSAITGAMASDPRHYSTPLDKARAFFEVLSCLAVVATLAFEAYQMLKYRCDYWKDRTNYFDLLASILLLLVIPLRFAHQQEQWHVFSVGYLLWTLRIFEYAVVFRHSGAHAQILWRIITSDFLQFLLVFVIILLAFSGSLIMALRGDNSLHVHTETSTFWDILFTGLRILVKKSPVVTCTGSSGYGTFSCILMFIFLFTCIVVLLHILIAQLSHTYQKVQQDAQRAVELNRAWIITRGDFELNGFPFIKRFFSTAEKQGEDNVINVEEVLEAWECPTSSEQTTDIRHIREDLDTCKLHHNTVNTKLAQLEHILRTIQDHLHCNDAPTLPVNPVMNAISEDEELASVEKRKGPQVEPLGDPAGLDDDSVDVTCA
ncbi:uncharacterized protein LOC124145414 [Haliotis rufescens]|uniref:uncharacterized protein LOC124145414 n=1 Tax=Haliotis rufescens TaxID=6454 RepID=UPI00201F195D|nr:uncharacterized protein LOC124145414 [Haliotis rufescens]